MVILEHDHTGEIVAVTVDPAYEHAVLLHESEARRRLARASNDPFVSTATSDVQDTFRPGSGLVSKRESINSDPCVLGCNSTASCEHVQSDAFTEQYMPDFASDCRDMLDGLESLSFLHMPFYPGTITRQFSISPTIVHTP